MIIVDSTQLFFAAILLQFHTLLQSGDDPTTSCTAGSNASDFVIILFKQKLQQTNTLQ